MKLIKMILVVVLCLVLLLLAGAIVILNSSRVQTGLAKPFMPEGLTVEKVHLGFSGMTLEGAVFSEDEVDIHVERVWGDFSLIETLSQRHLHLKELSVAGVVVTLKEMEPVVDPDRPVPIPEAPVPDVPEPAERPVDEEFELLWDDIAAFEGLFAEAWPWPPLSIDQLSVDALIHLPGDQQTITLQIEGNEIHAGIDPELRLTANYADSSDAAPVDRASIKQTLVLSLSPEANVTGLRVEGRVEADVLAEDAHASHALATRLDLHQREDRTGEEYRFSLTLDPDDPDPVPLASVQVAYTYESKTWAGTWSLAADTRAVAAFVDPILGGAWATVSADGSFDLDAAAQSAAIAGQAQVRAQQLDLYEPDLEAVPTLSLAADFHFSVDTNRIDVQALTVDLAAPIDTPLISLKAEQSFGFDLATNEPVYGDPAKPLLRLSIAGVPVDLINTFLPDMTLALTSLTGEIVVAGTGEDDLRFDTDRPLIAEGLSLVLEGQPLIEELDVALEASGSYRTEVLTFDVGSLTLRRGDASLLQATATATIKELAADPDIDLSAEWDIQLPELLAQPVAEPFRNLSKGTLRGTLHAAGSAKKLNSELDLRFADLVLAADDRRIDQLSLKIDAAIEEKMEHIKIAGPLSVQVGDQSTDLHLDMGLRPSEDVLQVQMKGRGETVYVDHLQLLADAFQNPDYDPPAVVKEEEDRADAPEPPERAEDVEREEDREGDAPVAAPIPDTEPVWTGLLAEADLEIGKLILPGEYFFTTVVLRARVEENAARLETFEAHLGESPAQATGALLFRSDHPETPYSLEGDFSLQAFDVGNFLRSADPETKPVLDAVVSVEGRASSEAPTLDRLADDLVGEFSLNASDGVFRALRRGAVSGTLGLAGAAGRIAGRLSGQEDVEAVSQLVTYFNEIPIDELSIEARRNVDHTIDLTQFELRNPEIRLQGEGKVDHVEGREIHQQPIALTLHIGARPPLARLFDDLKLLEEEPDEAGYRPLNRPVEITGNVGEPDPRPLWRVILESAGRRLLDGERNEEDRHKREKDDSPVDEIRGLFGI